MNHPEQDHDTNTITIITSEEESYDITVHYTRGRCTRSETRESPAEYAPDCIDHVEGADGRTLSKEEIKALGLTGQELMNLKEHKKPKQ